MAITKQWLDQAARRMTAREGERGGFEVVKLAEANPYHDQRGRFTARGGGGHSPALDAKLSEVEGEIRDRDGGEAIFVLGPNGEVIETNTAIGNATGAPGAIASVSLSGSNAKYAGAIVTHNHPAMGDSDDLLRRYDSFSPDDIRSAMGMGLSEARMVNKVSTQVLRPGPKGWGTPQEFREAAAHNFLNHDYNEPHVNENGVPNIYFKRIDATRDIAKSMGWTFEVTPNA